MTDILEILKKEARSKWAIVYEHDGWIEDAAKEIKRLRKDLSNSDYELNKALTEVDRLKAEVNQYENIIIPSWKREEDLWRQDEKDAVEFRRVLAEEIERLEKAAVKALDWIESADHKPGCPRIRDDYDCTCGRDEVIQALYGVFEGAQ